MNNDDIRQQKAKLALGIPRSNPYNGINYANHVNIKARDRLASFRSSVRRIDLIQAVSRFKWENLPIGLRSELLERILYFKAQAMFYYDSTLNQYLFLPYTLTSEGDNAIDMYVQYQMVKPLPFNGKSDAKKSTGKKTSIEIYLNQITRKPIYDMDSLKEIIEEKGIDWCKENCCIICNDYTQGLSQYIQPLSIIQETWINAQAEMPLFIRTAMFKALAPKLLRTTDQGTMDVILSEIQSIEDSILEGKTIIPVTAFQDLQELDKNGDLSSLIDSTFKGLEAYDNLRKSNLGVCNKGSFQKSAQTLQSEQDVNQQSTDLVLADSLHNRKKFTELVNHLFELNINVKEAEVISEDNQGMFEKEEYNENKEGEVEND